MQETGASLMCSPMSFPSLSLSKMATRRAYGVALAKLGQASQRVVALDGDTKNSTFSETFKKAFPDRYIECFIAEQNMVRSICLQRPFYILQPQLDL